MTSRGFSKIKELLCETGEDYIGLTPLEIYNKILETNAPIYNVEGCVSDYIIESILKQFDYRNEFFSQDIDIFCRTILKMLRSIHLDDKMMLVVTSVLMYCNYTDIELQSVNNLINSICDLDTRDMQDIASDIALTAELFKNNIIGSKVLSVESSNTMMQVVSSASDFLGPGCANSPMTNGCCAHDCLKTPEELGVDVRLITDLNKQIVDGASINPKDLFRAIDEISVYTHALDFDRTVPTIHDIANVRFCWSFRWIFDFILNTPGEETARQILNVTITCLLETEKKFKNCGNDYLTLIEMALNALDYAVNGPSYYTRIRAKQLNYVGMSKYSPDVLNSQTLTLLALQSEVTRSLSEYGYFAPLDKGGYRTVEKFDIDVNQGNCRSGNGSTEDLEEFDHRTLEILDEDIKKLLGESLELSTMLENEMRSSD